MEKKRFKGEIEVDESYFGGRRKGNRGRGAANKIPVFGILERGGKVRVDVVEDVKGDTLLGLTLKKGETGKSYLHRQVPVLRWIGELWIQARTD
jgi:hypothetical protein